MPKFLKTKRKPPKTVLKLPDLEHSKSAVLNSLTSASSQRSYDHAIREFIEWYCSEPRLAFNKTVCHSVGSSGNGQPRPRSGEIIDTRAPLIKHPDFVRESEWRLVSDRVISLRDLSARAKDNSHRFVSRTHDRERQIRSEVYSAYPDRPSDRLQPPRYKSRSKPMRCLYDELSSGISGRGVGAV